MGRARAPFPRSRLPLLRRLLADPLALRYWLAAAALAVLAGLLVHRSVDAARATEGAWGTTRPVVVLTRPVEPGDRLRGATAVERWPTRLVPSTARQEVASGDRAAAAIDPGTALTDALVTSGRAPIGDRRLVAVPLGEVALPLEEGDRVELWTATEPTFADQPTEGQGPRSGPIATDARVVQVLDGAAVVAVPADAVGAVARALSAGPVTVVGLP